MVYFIKINSGNHTHNDPEAFEAPEEVGGLLRLHFLHIKVLIVITIIKMPRFAFPDAQRRFLTIKLFIHTTFTPVVVSYMCAVASGHRRTPWLGWSRVRTKQEVWRAYKREQEPRCSSWTRGSDLLVNSLFRQVRLAGVSPKPRSFFRRSPFSI